MGLEMLLLDAKVFCFTEIFFLKLSMLLSMCSRCCLSNLLSSQVTVVQASINVHRPSADTF